MIEVVQNSEDGLSRRVWKFTKLSSMEQTDVNLALDEYREETRPTKRHKFTGSKWERLRAQRSTLPQPESIPLWVMREAALSLTINVGFQVAALDTVDGKSWPLRDLCEPTVMLSEKI